MVEDSMGEALKPEAVSPAIKIDLKSKILQRIAENFRNNAELAMETQHTKSNGTNYSMHQKSDEMMKEDDWDLVFKNGRGSADPR
jgi:hypothetical protein